MIAVLPDEGLPRAAAELLRLDGIDAVHVQEIGLLSAPDEEIIRVARAQGRVVFTLDNDFHQILALSAGSSPSVVFLRFECLRTRETARVVTAIVRTKRAELLEGSALSVSPTQVRVRRLPLRAIE